jgi:hypothetical protein
VRQRGRHLGDRVAHADVERRDDQRRDQQAAEAAGAKPEVPAGEIARDDRADAQRPERPDPGVAAQPPLLEIIGADLDVADAALLVVTCHRCLPVGGPLPPVGAITGRARAQTNADARPASRPSTDTTPDIGGKAASRAAARQLSRISGERLRAAPRSPVRGSSQGVGAPVENCGKIIISFTNALA